MRLFPSFLMCAAAASFCSSGMAQAAPAVVGRSVPMCTAKHLSLTTDDEKGDFNGMSHSGTLLVLRNIGSTACRVEVIPQLTFTDATHALSAKGEMQNARFLHPGPVVLPAVIAVGAEVTASLRWVSGEVYDKSTCITPTKITLQTTGGSLSAEFHGHLCGDATKGGVTYQMTRFLSAPGHDPKAGSK